MQAFEAFLKEFDLLYWIAGGLPKSEGIDSLIPYFSEISQTYLIGEAQESFAKVLEKSLSPFMRVETLKKAVDDAYTQAKQDLLKGEKKTALILLSPACSSYDQFKNYEERGNFFKEIANLLVS